MKRIIAISAGAITALLLVVAVLSLPKPKRLDQAKPLAMMEQGIIGSPAKPAERFQSAWERQTADAEVQAQSEMVRSDIDSWADEMERRYGDPELTSVARKWDILREQAQAALQDYESTQSVYTLAAVNGSPLTPAEDEELAVRSETQLLELNRLNRAATVAANELNIFYLKYMKNTFDVRLN